MSGACINMRLVSPVRAVKPLELAQIWHEEIIEIELVGMSAFAKSPSLLNKVRGALGSVLVESGSQAVIERRTCDWKNTCGAEVLFGKKPQIKIGACDCEITKPYILSARKKGHNLIIAISIFGFASNWVREVTFALVQALRSRVDWKNISKDGKFFVPKNIELIEPNIKYIHSVVVEEIAPKEVKIEFLTPFDAERGELASKPFLVFNRLVRRLAMLALWHEVKLNFNWEELEALWLSYTYDVVSGNYNINRGGHKFKNNIMMVNEIMVKGDLELFWSLLVVGERVNIGRGANIGLGKYVLSHVG